MGQNFTFRPLNERPHLSGEADQTLTSQECHKEAFRLDENECTERNDCVISVVVDQPDDAPSVIANWTKATMESHPLGRRRER